MTFGCFGCFLHMRLAYKYYFSISLLTFPKPENKADKQTVEWNLHRWKGRQKGDYTSSTTDNLCCSGMKPTGHDLSTSNQGLFELINEQMVLFWYFRIGRAESCKRKMSCDAIETVFLWRRPSLRTIIWNRHSRDIKLSICSIDHRRRTFSNLNYNINCLLAPHRWRLRAN